MEDGDPDLDPYQVLSGLRVVVKISVQRNTLEKNVYIFTCTFCCISGDLF